MPADPKQPEGERGSIAILALWGIALIFMLLAPVAFMTRSEIKVTGNALAASRARLAAEAGTQLGLARLLSRRDAGTLYFDGTPETWRQGTTSVSIAITDEAGKIDLNVAPQELLAGLFVAVGRSQEEALLLACNILDRRGDSGAGCPEPDEGIAAARPPGRRFLVPEELAQLPGIDDALYERVADDITVVSGASAIDPLVASRDALMAIPGATASLVDAFLESRAMSHDVASTGGSLAMAAASPYLMATTMRDFTIAATAATPDRARFRAELQVRLTGQAAHPYQVVAWRTPPSDRGAQAAAPRPRVP